MESFGAGLARRVVAGSRRYLPWDTDLSTPAAWSARRASWMEERSLPADGTTYVAELLEELDTVTAQVARRLPRNADAQIVKGKVKLTALEQVEPPAEVEAARAAVTDLLPESDLPGPRMEVDRWTGFTRTLAPRTWVL
jgi:hypothetical protein